MDCSEVRKILSEHIEGDGSPKQQALLIEHLRSCNQCTLYAAEIKKTIETLHGLEEIEPPAWLTAKVMKKIRAEAQPRKLWIERLFFPLHMKLPLEALAALLITVAAVFIYKSMGPELHKMDVQPQAPAVKIMPAEPEKALRKEDIQKKEKEMGQTERVAEGAKHKDNAAEIETRKMTIRKEERPFELPARAPAAPTMPAPSSSFAPSPSLTPAMKQAETGKAAGMAARDETMQKAAPAASRSELAEEKKAAGLTTVTLSVRELDAAKKEIETYLVKNNGELKVSEESESGIILTVMLDPSKIHDFLAHLGSLGRIKEDLRVLSLQGGLFKLIIEKAPSKGGFLR